MGLSTGAADAFGAIGGGVLAACLLPQLIKLLRTKSARDVNLFFLVMYLLAMVCSFLYLYFEDAFVAWVCAVIEIAFIALIILVKLYYDTFGPHAWRRVRRARPEARLTTSQSFAAQVGVEVQGLSPAFAELHRPAPTHSARHLLLDARLQLPGSSAAAGAAGAAGAGGEGREADRSAHASSGDDVLEEVKGMLEACLFGAGLAVRRRTAQAFPSFRQRRQREQQAGEEGGEGGAGAAAAAEAGEEVSKPHMVALACRDGYATAIWHAPSSTLSLDLLAASDSAVPRMARAAQALCEQLVDRWPGSQIEAASVARLPRRAGREAAGAGEDGKEEEGEAEKEA